MNERYEIQRELKKFFEKITLDNCGHLLQNHINKTEEQLKNRLKNNQKLEIVSSFYGSKAAIMQHIKDDLLSEDCLEQLTDYFLDQEWKDSYFLYFPIPEDIKAIAYSSSNKHNWDKGNLKCEEYIIIIKKSKKLYIFWQMDYHIYISIPCWFFLLVILIFNLKRKTECLYAPFFSTYNFF